MRTDGPKTDHIDWDNLRTALHLARAGSVRRAARALGVSHSTVLRRIDGLERSTKVRLFERKADGYELTHAGQDVFDSAGELEEIVRALERRVEGRDLRLSGPVRVTLPDPFLPLLLPAFQEFAKAYPEITVTVAAALAFADLAHREADIAIRAAAQAPEDLVGRKLALATIGVYGTEAYLEGRSTKELAALDWIGFESGSPLEFEQWMRKNIPVERVRLRTSTSTAMRDAVDAGIGVAVFPCALGGARPGWRRIRRLPGSAPLWMLTHKDLRTTARVRVLRDFLSDAIAKKRALIEGR